jgi:hypothetical protein
MLPINVVVASSVPDVKAEGICAAICANAHMSVAGGRVVTLAGADALIDGMAADVPCAVVLVGAYRETQERATRWLEARRGLVVLQVTIVDDFVRLSMRGMRMGALLSELRQLVGHALAASDHAPPPSSHAGARPRKRIAREAETAPCRRPH